LRNNEEVDHNQDNDEEVPVEDGHAWRERVARASRAVTVDLGRRIRSWLDSFV